MTRKAILFCAMSLLLVGCDTQITIPDANIKVGVDNSSNKQISGNPSTSDPASPPSNANKKPIVHTFTANPTNVVASTDEKITFTVVATDPEGDTLSYTWAATKGTLSSTTGQVTSWSPTSNDGELISGTSTISVSVNDGKDVTTASVNIQIGAGKVILDEGSEVLDDSPASPSPTPTSSSSPTSTPVPTPTSSPTAQPSSNPTPSATATPTPSTTTSPEPTPSPTPSPTASPALSSPTNLITTEITSESATVSWKPVDSSEKYQLYLNGQIQVNEPSSTTFTFTGLTKSTPYTVRVRAVNAANQSELSETLSFSTPGLLGNVKLGFLNMTAIESADGLDAQNGHAYVGHFTNGFFNNDRFVRDLNIATGTKNDIKISSRGSVKISGVAITGATIWAAIDQFDNDSRNLYKYHINGTQLKRYQVGNAGTIISDIAVDKNTGVVYIGSRTSGSIIKHDDNNPDNSQLLFSGANPIDPLGLATDTAGNVYTFDGISKKLIKFSSSGNRVLEFGPTGASGTGENFTAVSDVAVDPLNGDIYMTGNASGTIKIFRYNSSGNFIHSFSDVDLIDPRKLSVDTTGKIYIIDQTKKGVLLFSAGTSL